MHNIGENLRGNICEKGNSFAIKTIGHTVNEALFVSFLNTLLTSNFLLMKKRKRKISSQRTCSVWLMHVAC